eukprot:Gb_36775 [translate_table: standard]
MVQLFGIHKKKLNLFLGQMFKPHSTKGTLPTNIKTNALQIEQGNVNANSDNLSSGHGITLGKQGLLKWALYILYPLDQQGVHADSSSYASILQGCVDNKALPEGKLVHAHMINTGFKPDSYIGTKLLIMYAKCGSLVDARQVLAEMPKRNVVSWTAMISSYVQHGFGKEALTLFYQMQLTDIQPNHFTVASVLPACANLAALKHGKEIHEYIIRCGFQSDLFTGSALLDMYVKCSSIENARKLFDKMPERDIVSWNAMVAGYAQNGILPACANLAALEYGKEIHEDIVRSGFQSDIIMGNALVDMYGKCGSIEDARKLFHKIPIKNLISWTAIIVGCALHGCGKEALLLFEQMQQSGIKPDRVTFVGVLSACCHAGLVDTGWQYFDCMSRDYHITPAIEHYCCMVDLLGRAGHLDEARDFINKMPIKPESAVWGSLLAACRVYNNMELGEYVAEHLFELDPQNAAHYVLLSSIYAAAGKWEEAEKVRHMMQDRRVKTLPGWCVPNTIFVLHDVEEEQKEHFVYHHSENLATAFGLLNMYPGTPSQIVKNLWVCGDCHSATKFISKIVVQEFVVRDVQGIMLNVILWLRVGKRRLHELAQVLPPDTECRMTLQGRKEEAAERSNGTCNTELAGKNEDKENGVRGRGRGEGDTTERDAAGGAECREENNL